MDTHTFTHDRRGPGGVDAARNPIRNTWVTVAENQRGTLGTPAYRDVQRAAAAGIIIDAVLATTYSALAQGDRVTVLGHSYTVLWAKPIPATGHYRVALQTLVA